MTTQTQFLPAARGWSRTLRPLLGSALAVWAVVAVLEATPELRPVYAAVLGSLAIALAGRGAPNPLFILRDAAILAAIGGLARGGLEAWHDLARWTDAAHLSLAGGVIALALYLGAGGARAAQGKPLAHRTALFLLGVPFFVKALFLLSAPVLLEALARGVTFGLVGDPEQLHWIGRALTLFVVAEAVISGVGLVLDRRLSREARLHGLLIGTALFTAATPQIADWGSGALLAGVSIPWRQMGVLAAAIIAEAGLWSITYLITGSLIDALRGQRPTLATSLAQWKQGMLKGGIYGGAFMAILLIVASWHASPLWQKALAAAPVAAFAFAGVAGFPLAKTVVESFDGSAPFLLRLRLAYRAPWNYLRGAVIGAGLGLLAAGLVPFATGGARFLFGLVLGAAAYAGIDLLHDGAAIARGMRRHFQSPRFYLLGAFLGGVVGGALASYFDAAQCAAVAEKFQRYVAVYFPAAGFKSEHYVIFPLFSKWGQTDLGLVTGGVRLFFNESLSGVINWAFAAPLFSINLVFLTALVQRDDAPIKRLLTRGGAVDLVEQAFRVQRWGLWMAPVIYSFLRLAPEPSWYNQDGAVRSLVAILMSGRLSPDAFHDWSLTLFLGLLAYDWLRVAIWFDHMGLRVATLVNASFVVGDWLDEKAARWLGHGARTRIIPEGIRRFATWAPLLIPFYIPRGGEWDKVWGEAERVRAEAGPLLPPVQTLISAYAVTGVAALVIGAALLLHRRSRKSLAQAVPPPRKISNGILTLELSPEGCSQLRVTSALRPGAVLDLTKRPVAPGDGRGTCFYVRENGRILSRVTRPDCLARSTPTSFHFVSSAEGLAIEASVTILRATPGALWVLRLVNQGETPRRLSLTSLREIALADWDSYERTPSYQGLFIGTSFVPALTAIIAHNRKLKAGARREVFFHAAAWREEDAVALKGYQDSRACLIGAGTGDAPGGFAAMRSPAEEGTCFTFDPAASLDLEIALPAGGAVEIRFADGYATSEADAALALARCLDRSPPDVSALEGALAKIRPTRDRAADGAAAEFTPGTLRLGWDTPRPWAHVIANSWGHGAVITNDGSIFSFARNSQQNGLTPFIADTIPAQRIGQAIYVRDLDTGETATPGFVPFRRADAAHRVEFARGSASFFMARGTLELEHLIHFPPGALVELRLLTIRNKSAMPKRYRVTPYFEMVLGELPQDSARRMVVQENALPNALFFENPQNTFEGGVVFVATSLVRPERETWRARFLGEAERDFTAPLFAERMAPDEFSFSDPTRVAAFAGEVTVPPGGAMQIALVLGGAATADEAKTLVARYADPQSVLRAHEETRRFWDETTGVLRIETNDPGFDRLVNDWLPHQLLAARLWGRLGPNQRSGGFGFRDQLQDVLPLCLLKPDVARAQILLHASQQFLEGDVLQWWHGDREGRTGLGARNRASDPHLWLPYLVARYIEITGDAAILDEPVRYLEGMPIPPGQEGIAFAPRPSRDVAPLYDHCRRAIERTLAATGAHGLPLMGTGDWNDGLSDIGAQGRGESVWLGFFLFGILRDFTKLAASRGDGGDRARWLSRSEALKAALDGQWHQSCFARAITDEGEAMVFADALIASWPVLSGAVSAERGRVSLETAMSALEKDDLVLLLDPAFTKKSKPQAGRIADYPPGVRENGGQYSHGVSWLIDAHAVLADRIEAEGDAALAAPLRAKAASLWLKISPLGRALSDGLAPHQQPADVYWGPGYEGRGGWSWYTGAAARMLSAAYALLGISVEGGAFTLAPHAFAPKGPLTLKRVTYRGRVYEP